MVEIYLPDNLDDFSVLKIFLELGKTLEKREQFLEKMFLIDIHCFVKQIVKNLDYYRFDDFSFISNINKKGSDLKTLNSLLLFARILPSKKEEILKFYLLKVKKK